MSTYRMCFKISGRISWRMSFNISGRMSASTCKSTSLISSLSIPYRPKCWLWWWWLWCWLCWSWWPVLVAVVAVVVVPSLAPSRLELPSVFGFDSIVFSLLSLRRRFCAIKLTLRAQSKLTRMTLRLIYKATAAPRRRFSIILSLFSFFLSYAWI